MLTFKSSEACERPFEIVVLVGTILYILYVQISLIANSNINWDEFLYLSLIFEYSSGTLARSLQTFYVHFFTWMTNLDWDEIKLILLSRNLMLCCELLTLGFIFLISRKFVSAQFALIGVVSYLASGYVLMYGASFRADPIITALLMAGIYLLMDKSNHLWKCLAASITIALAIVISIKSVLYIPPLIGALVWRTRDIGEMSKKLSIYIGFALSIPVTALIFYLWHRSTLSLGAKNALPKFGFVFSTVFIDVPFWPRKYHSLSWITASWPQILLILSGFLLMWRRRKNRANVQLIVSVLFALPILSIFFYRNAYPYFFPFIAAPLMIVVSIGAQEVSKNKKKGFAKSVVAILLLFMIIHTLDKGNFHSYNQQSGQREIIATIHTMFPEKTPYIDRNSMISSYPKCGFFMSSWGLQTYRKKGEPIFKQILEECEPKFLITNSHQLALAMNARSSENNPYRLFDQDAEVLRANFIHHWGSIWVAGKSFGPAMSPTEFDISIEGIYSVESSGQIILDKQQYNDGDYIFLSKGSHVINRSPQQVDLRFGRHLPRPDFAPTKPIYFGF